MLTDTELIRLLAELNFRLDRPVQAYAKWADRIPEEHRSSVLKEPADERVSTEADPHCLALLKHHRSLMPMAMEARKPIFHLRPADGARGSHVVAARRCGDDFRTPMSGRRLPCDGCELRVTPYGLSPRVRVSLARAGY